MDDMALRIKNIRSMMPALKDALQSFQSSSASFKVIKTVRPSQSQQQDGEDTSSNHGPLCRSLYILDSSYNPPSKAHLALAAAALSASEEPKPHRLLLCFSTDNADKKPSPASFEQRLTMMVLFAEDLQKHQQEKSKTATDPVVVDISLTTAPFYTDKSIAITKEAPPQYQLKPAHFTLIGYDTLTRFFAPKYYKKHTPPLSALEPFFAPGHQLRVLLRPSSSSDNTVTGDTEEEQREYIKSLGNGSLEEHGMKREWAKQIGILEGEDIAMASGISSTVIRKAAKEKDWTNVDEMCTPGVAAWVRDQQLYAD
ncbi:Nucleotidylyl transferase [Tothia fuscella]|uniref:Nucleotidylyl transferase n=1 Tax=Tothia fuscella TaxID=1048955 RepID=A0A9P4TZY8_9PEZI|nr:Nucleotidylyl transferase [Tothia fuscella]